MRYSKPPATQALLALSFLLGLSASVLASAETREQIPPMTLRLATSKALANNPGIKSARVDVDIEQARRDALALGTPYRLEAEIENFAGTDTVSGFDASETTFQLSKMLEFGGKRERRESLGDAQLRLAQIESTRIELELTANVARRFLGLLRLQEQRNLAAEAVAIGERTLATVKRRVAVGTASEAEESSALVSVSRIELAGKRIDSEFAGACVSLATLWGSAEPAFTDVAGNIFSIPPMPAYAQLKARIDHNPELLRYSSEARIRSAEQRLAQARQRPDIDLSAGVRHLAAPSDTAFVIGFSMPFGAKGRGEPLVRETDSQIEKLPLVRDQRLLELEATLYGYYQTLLASHYEYSALQGQIIPEAQRAIQFYERGFEAGSYSLLELTAAQERLLTLRREALDAAASFHQALIEIESLLGSSNPGGAMQ